LGHRHQGGRSGHAENSGLTKSKNFPKNEKAKTQMINATQFEGSASSSRSKLEGESSVILCDRHSRTRAFSQRQLPTDHDYATSTREYQTDQSSLKPAPTAAGPAFEKRQKQQQQQQKQTHRCTGIDGVTPYQEV
jgi:hypothetical protein